MLEGCTSHVKLSDESVGLHSRQNFKELRQRDVGLLAGKERADRVDFEVSFDHVSVVNCLLTLKVGRRKLDFDLLLQSLNVELLRVKCHSELVALAISLHQVIWCTVADNLTIDHDSNLVAELLSLVHSMCREDNSRVLEVLDQVEEASARDWVNSCSWLVQEVGFWAVE